MLSIMTIIGLGNPGEKYDNTRHNAGFMALDAFAQKYEFPEFKLDKKSNSQLSESLFEKESLTLAKPQTMMNNSGVAAKAFAKVELIVIHDDIDLPIGKIKISVGSGSAGHKGIESIIQHLKTNDFMRIRIGIQPERGKPEEVEKFVLKPFTKDEFPLLETAIQNTTNALHLILKENIQKAMNQFN